MIYSNIEVISEVKNYDFGKVSSIMLGESGRGRRFINMVTPHNAQIKKGINESFYFGQTQSGKSRINDNGGSDGVILSSKRSYTRRGCGYVYSYGAELIALGYGADGDAGRIGRWYVKVYTVLENKPAWFFVRYAGDYDPEKNTLFYWNGSRFNECSESSINTFIDFYEDKGNTFDKSNLPFTVSYNHGLTTVKPTEIMENEL